MTQLYIMLLTYKSLSDGLVLFSSLLAVRNEVDRKTLFLHSVVLTESTTDTILLIFNIFICIIHYVTRLQKVSY
jgi:predicted esterase